MIGEALHRFKSAARYVVVDNEAEGLNLHYARPFQVAYAIGNNKGVTEFKSDYIWWDDLAMSKDAAAITRFDYNVYKERARPALEVLKEYEEVINDPSTYVVFYNGLGYDHYIYNNWRRDCGLPNHDTYLLRSIDVMVLAKGLRLGLKPDVSSRGAFLKWQYRVLNADRGNLKLSLTAVSKAEGIEHDYSTTHEGGSDVNLTSQLFYKYINRIEF